ncbi:MAG: AMIN domain-containing protein, partial [Bacillota bacterium]
MKGKLSIILFSFLFLLLFNISASAIDYYNDIYFEGEKVKEESNFKNIDGEIYIKARFLSKLIDADLKWKGAIQLVELQKEDKYVKMMVGNPYLEINNSTVKVKNGLILEDGHTYLPFKQVVEAFNYMFTIDKDDIYVLNAKVMINEIAFNEEKNSLEINLSDNSDYEIKRMKDDKDKLLIRIKRATLSGNFRDELPNDKFDFNINRSNDKMYLELMIDSELNNSFFEGRSVEEKEDKLIVNYFSQLKDIAWDNENGLEIEIKGKVNPEISYLDNPKRMVIDFPSTIINGYENNFSENRWVKGVNVSQSSKDPMVSRVTLELNESSHFEQKHKDNRFILSPEGEVRLRDLVYNESVISFSSNKKIEPKLFTLSKPERLVIDLPGAYRDSDFKDNIKVNDDFVEEIRTSRFNDETIRIVADLKENLNYNWTSKRSSDGYKNAIYLNNNIRGIEIKDEKSYNEISVSLNNEVEYEVEKLESPTRLVVDIKGLESFNENFEISKLKGNITDLDYSKYDKNVVRLVFSLDKYFGHVVNSKDESDKLNITLWKSKKDEKNEINEELKDIIVIDPGHGGFDPGAIGPNGLQEKVVNLNIAL